MRHCDCLQFYNNVNKLTANLCGVNKSFANLAFQKLIIKMSENVPCHYTLVVKFKRQQNSKIVT